jgi:hypothetical protein
MEHDHAYPVIAGYLSTVEEWIEFTARWREALATAKVGCFHAAELWANEKGSEFEDKGRWSLQAKFDFVNTLLNIIGQHALRSVVACIDNQAYLEVVGDRKNFQNKHGSQYELCGFRIAILVGKWAAENEPFPVSFVFDEGNRYRHQFERGYGIVRRGPHHFTPYLGPLTFASDARVVPLQAADLLAWTVARTAHDELVEGRSVASVPWATRAWNQQPCLEGFFHRDLLISLRDDAQYWRQQNNNLNDKDLSRFLRAVKPASERILKRSV